MLELRYPLTSNLMSLIVYVNHAFSKACLEDCGAKLSHFRILSNLARHTKARSIHSVAQDLRLSDSTITTTAKNMEQVGLVNRRESATDRRSVLVDITEQGVVQLEIVERVLARLVSELWEPLSSEHKMTLKQGTAKIDYTQNEAKHFIETVRMVTAYVNVYTYTHSAFFESVKARGLTINEFRLLFELYGHPRGIELKKLGALLLLRPNEVTKAADGLARQNLIIRTRTHLDNRRVVIELNSLGFALLRKSAPAVDKAFLSSVCETSDQECAHYLEIADTIISKQQ